MCGGYNCTYHCVNCRDSACPLSNEIDVLRLGKSSCSSRALERELEQNINSIRFKHTNIINTVDHGVVLASDDLRGAEEVKKHARDQSYDDQSDNVYSVLERCKCDLWKCTRESWDSQVCRNLSFITQIAHGVQYLHKHGFVHLDLKSENVMVAQHRSGPLVPKIIDFGFLKPAESIVARQRIPFSGTDYMQPPEMLVTKNLLLQHRIKSIPYKWIYISDDGHIRHETLQFTPDTVKLDAQRVKKMDVFMLGAIFFEMLHPTTHEVMQRRRSWCKLPSQIKKKKRIRPRVLSSDVFFKAIQSTAWRAQSVIQFAQLTLRMLDPYADARPTIDEIVDTLKAMEPFEKKITWEDDSPHRPNGRRTIRRRSSIPLGGSGRSSRRHRSSRKHRRTTTT